MTITVKATISAGLMVAAVAAGIYFDRSVLSNSALPLLSSDVNEQGSHYQFINPLLFCQDQNISSLTNSTGNQIQKTIGEYMQSQKDLGQITDAAVYFRDLGDGPWALVNPTLRSIPASLLKVPTAIGVYRRAEKDPAFLSSKFKFGGGVNANSAEHFQPLEHVEPGKTYTMEELVRYMLQDSDNQALLMIGNAMDLRDLSDAYSDLGIDVPSSTSTAYTINVRTFASFFRVLYNASYLNQTDSEHMLSLLSQSAFPQGLEAGVPKNMTVAHKFGEYAPANGPKQLNDCGIIYKPHRPYILCVMAQGNDFDKLAKVISAISSKVYGTLQAQD